MHEVPTTARYLFIKGGPGIRDAGLGALLADLADKADATLSAFAEKRQEVRTDPNLSKEGKQARARDLAAVTSEALEALHRDRVQRLQETIERRRGELLSPASPGFALPNLAGHVLEEFREGEKEARALFREMAKQEDGPLKLKVALMEAARRGDRQTLRVFLHAPAAFPLVDQADLQEAIEEYAAATDPEGLALLREQESTLSLINDNYSRARTVLKDEAGDLLAEESPEPVVVDAG